MSAHLSVGLWHHCPDAYVKVEPGDDGTVEVLKDGES